MAGRDPQRALIIEADPILAKAARNRFRIDTQISADIVGDCATARKKLAESSYTLLFIDIELEGSGGLALLEELLTSEDPPSVIVVTGAKKRELAAEAFRLGATGYIDKSILTQTIMDDGDFDTLTEENLLDYETRLRESNDRLREIYESTNEGIGISDPDGRYEYVNHVMAKMAGYDSPRELIGTLAKHRYANVEDQERLRSILMKKGEVRDFEVQGLRKDGSPIWLTQNVVLNRDEHGNVKRFIAFITDITERKKAEESLKQKNEELNAYARTVSHDLKGTLSMVSLMTEQVRESIHKGEMERSLAQLDLLKKGVLGAQDRIEDILRLAQSGQVPSEVQEFDVGELVAELAREHSALIEEHLAEIRVEGELGRITANLQQVRQAFSNLITNCVQHNDSGSPVVEVRRLAHRSDGAHAYLVRDNGSGMPAEEIEDMFRPFIKGASSTGSGIGLSIVHRIAQVYGGEVRAYNDNGACFELTLFDYNGES